MPATKVVMYPAGTTQVVVPEGCYGIQEIRAWGSGSAPRGGVSLSTGSGGGGSGGLSRRTTFLAVRPGETFTLAIGASVGPGAYNVATTYAGLPTTVTYDRTSTVVCKANGGSGTQSPARNGMAGGVTAGAVGDVLTAGATGTSAANVTSSDGGAGATAPGTGGGTGGAGGTNGVPATPGNAPGGGGGGGRGNQSAGGVPSASGAGAVEFTFLMTEFAGTVA